MILEADKLSFSFEGGKKVFQDVSFSLEKGEILTILGPNGAGKSTLLNCLANLYRPDSGRILLNGKPLDSYKVRDVAKIMGYVPQNHVPAYAYSVRDFVVMGRAPYLGTFQQPSEEDYALTDQVLEEMGMSELAFRPYTNISGGERQQAVIARAIVQQPELILFDEPTNHLDYGNQLNMIQMIRRLVDKGYSIILTTHMPDHAIILNGKVGVLSPDGSFCCGSTEELMQEELLCRLYHSPLRIVYVKEVGRKVCIADASECSQRS